jgi:hypothetical protein
MRQILVHLLLSFPPQFIGDGVFAGGVVMVDISCQTAAVTIVIFDCISI